MALEDDIEAAFKSQPLPEGDRFVTGDPEGAEELFAYQREELSPQLLARHTAAVNFLSDEGFCFLLPAFMRVSLREPHSGVADALLTRLVPPKGNPNRPSYVAWWGRLSGDQKRVVVRFLRYLGPHSEDDLAEVADVLEATLE
jgi:hypothetical protein